MPTAALRNGKCGPRKRIKMAVIVGRSEDSCDESSLFRCTLRLSSFPTATGLGRWLCYLSQTASQTFSYCCRRPLAVAQFLSMENASQRSNRVRLLDPSRLSGASSASHKVENAHRCHSHLLLYYWSAGPPLDCWHSPANGRFATHYQAANVF